MTKRIWLSRISTTVQLIFGFIFGIALITGVAAGAGYYYFKKMSVLPERPVFYEETTEGQKELQQQQNNAESPPEETAPLPAPAPAPPEPEPEPEPAEPELPPNAYLARVTWPQGLSLRSEPSIDAGRVGGIAYNAEIIVLEMSADSNWQKVRLPWSEQEGWVKNGNTERVAY